MLVSRIEHDFRKVRPGELYVCLPHSNDYEFEAAYGAGCRAFLCERELALPSDAVQVMSENVRLSMAEGAAAFYGYPAKQLKLIGFCGEQASDKTSAALLFCGVMENVGIECAYIGSGGTVLCGKTLENITSLESVELHHLLYLLLLSGIKYAAVEVTKELIQKGVLHGLELEISVFMDSASLQYGIIGKCQAVVSEKYGNITANIKSREQCMDLWAYRMIPTCRNGAVGMSLTVSMTRWNIDRLRAPLKRSFEAFVPSPDAGCSRFTLAATGAAMCLGVNTEIIFEKLQHVTIPGRMEVISGGDSGAVFVIDHAYTGKMLEKALRTLRLYTAPSKRLICVFGAAGGRHLERRRDLALTASRLADLSIITEENPDLEEPESVAAELLSYFDTSSEYKVICNRERAIRYAVMEAACGDVVLLAGKGMERYQLVKGRRLPFIERDIVLDELAKTDEKITKTVDKKN